MKIQKRLDKAKKEKKKKKKEAKKRNMNMRRKVRSELDTETVFPTG